MVPLLTVTVTLKLRAHSLNGLLLFTPEGLNNKIKVAKHIGYGYRNDSLFIERNH